MKRALAAALIVLLGVGFGFQVFTSSAWFQDRLQVEVRALVLRLLNMTVEWKRLTVHPLSLSVEIEELKAFHGDSREGTPFLHAPRVTGALRWSGLLNRRIDIDPIVVERPVIRFGNDGEGWVNFLDIDAIDKLAGMPSAGGAWSVVVRRVQLVDADIDFFLSTIDLRAHLVNLSAEGRFDELAEHDRIPIVAHQGHGLYRMFGRDFTVESLAAGLAVEIIKGPWVDLVVQRAEIHGSYPNAVLRAGGRIVDVARRHVLHLTGEGETELAFLNDVFFDRPRLTGTATFSARYDGDFEHFRVAGDVTSDAVLADDLIVGAASAKAVVTEDNLTIQQSSGNLFGGRLGLAGTLNFHTLGWSAAATADGVDAEALKSYVKVLDHLSGEVSGRFSGSGELEPATAVAGTLALTAPTFAFGWGDRRLDFERPALDARFAWDGEYLTVTDATFVSAREQVQLAGIVERDLSIDAALSVQSGDFSILKELTGIAISGWGTAEGVWRGRLDDPEFEFQFTSRDVGMPWFHVDAASGLLGVTLHEVYLADVVAEAGGGKAQLAEGHVRGLDAEAELDFNVEISSVPIAPTIHPLLGEAVPVDGRFSGSLQISGPATAPVGRIHGIALNGSAWGEPLDEVRGELFIGDNRLQFVELSGTQGTARLNADGFVAFNGPMALTVRGENIDLQSSSRLRGYAVAGTADATLFVSSSDGGAVALAVTAEARTLSLYGVELGAARGSLTKYGERLTASVVAERGQAALQALLSGDFPANVTFAVDKLELAPAMRDVLKTPSSLQTSARGALRLPLKRAADAEGDIILTDVRLTHGRTRLENDGPFVLRAAGQGLSVERMRVTGDNTAGEVLGRVGFNSSLDLKVTGAVELQLFTLFIDGLKSAEGRLELEGNVRGTTSKPQVTAGLKLRQGRLQLADVNLLFDDVTAEGAFSAGQIVVESMRARLGGGSMVGGGILTMDGLVPTAVSLSATLTEAEARIPLWLATRANGRVEMIGPLDDVLLRGDLEIVHALYNERIDWEGLILRFRRPAAQPLTLTKQKGFHLDLGVHSAGSVFVKNNLADLKLRGDLRVVGYPPEIGLTGNLQVVSGNILFRENVFAVQTGQINFAESDRVRPIIDLQAKTRVEEATGAATRRFDDITMSAAGPADDLQIDFESSPPMSREDIISLLYIRRRATEDVGGSDTLARNEAVSLAFKLNDDLAGFQSEVQQYFGFENLVLEPSFADTTRSGTLKLRAEKILRRDLKASISTSLSSTDLDFWLDYALTDNMLLDFGWNSVEEIRGGSSNVGNFKIRPRLHFEFQ